MPRGRDSVGPGGAAAPVEIGDFRASHRVWTIASAICVLIAGGLVAIGAAWNQLSPALWGTAAVFVAFALVVRVVGRFMQHSLRIEPRGLVSESAMRESVLSWSDVARARVHPSRVPRLVLEGHDGRLLAGYGRALINRPLEEAADLINRSLPVGRG